MSDIENTGLLARMRSLKVRLAKSLIEQERKKLGYRYKAGPNEEFATYELLWSEACDGTGFTDCQVMQCPHYRGGLVGCTARESLECPTWVEDLRHPDGMDTRDTLIEGLLSMRQSEESLAAREGLARRPAVLSREEFAKFREILSDFPEFVRRLSEFLEPCLPVEHYDEDDD